MIWVDAILIDTIRFEKDQFTPNINFRYNKSECFTKKEGLDPSNQSKPATMYWSVQARKVSDAVPVSVWQLCHFFYYYWVTNMYIKHIFVYIFIYFER
jgi:hypothetical protein